MQSIEKEFSSPNYGDLAVGFMDEESAAPWYVAAKVVEIFRDTYGRYPGSST